MLLKGKDLEEFLNICEKFGLNKDKYKGLIFTSLTPTEELRNIENIRNPDFTINFSSLSKEVKEKYAKEFVAMENAPKIDFNENIEFKRYEDKELDDIIEKICKNTWFLPVHWIIIIT